MVDVRPGTEKKKCERTRKREIFGVSNARDETVYNDIVDVKTVERVKKSTCSNGTSVNHFAIFHCRFLFLPSRRLYI